MKTHQSPRDRTEGGWVLWTVLGALGVIAILALAVALVWIRQYDLETREAEKRSLADFGDAFRRVVVENTSITNPAGFASVVALRTGKPLSDVQNNVRGGSRVVIADPNIGLGPYGTTKLAYTQSSAGSVLPNSPRLVVISSLGRALPESLTTGATLTTSQFTNIWNTVQGQKPTGWTWDGDPNDLYIQRIHLTDLFLKVKLRYYSMAASDQGYYSVSSTPTGGDLYKTTLPAQEFERYFLRGSYLSCYSPAGALQFRDILQDDGLIYTCQNGIWRQGMGSRGRRVGPVIRHPTPEEFADALEIFITEPIWGNNSSVTMSQMLYSITNFLATCAYNNSSSARLNVQGAMMDNWGAFTGAQINKP